MTDDHSGDSDLPTPALEEIDEEEDYPPRPKRFWFYSRDRWEPEWWFKWGLPDIRRRNTDEWCRRTIVWGTGLTGYVVIPWKTCWCDECHWARAQTYEYAKPFLDKMMHDKWIEEDRDGKA